MPHLHLHLLGGFDVRLPGQSDAVLSIKKAQALLAYLAMYPGQQQPRDKLAALLWGDMADEFARANLRQTLAVLRKALAHKQCPCVLNAGTNLYLAAEQAEIDVVRFEQDCDQATPVALEEAVALYRGEFLEGFNISEEAFEDWMLGERRRLHERQRQAMNALLAHYANTDRHERAIDIGVRLLTVDPLQEAVHRLLMRCYHAQGMRRSLQRQYASCREILQRELGIEPAAETAQLYRQLISQSPAPAIITATSVPIPAETKPATVAPVTSAASAVRNTQPAYRRTLFALAGLLIAILTGVTGYWQLREKPGTEKSAAAESPKPLSFIAPDVGKPSIAILPFKNMSNNREQEYFADGMTEDLIAALSKIPELFIIARNSSFSYKGKTLEVRRIAQELGVHYVLEGSVRRQGDAVRITAELIDAGTGGHLWNERYDGTVKDVFAWQDRINQQIITTLQLELNPQAKAALQTKGTENVAAHEAFLRGLRLFNVTNRSGRRWAAVDSQVQQAFERAIALDPRYALPYAGLGLVYWQKFITEPDPGWKWKKNALQLAKISLALAENSLALRLHARQYLALDIIGTPGANLMAGNQYDLAVAELRRARALAPNDADTLADLADTLVFAGEAKEAGELMRHAMRLNPNFPTWYYRPAGIACYMNEQYPQAVQEFSDWYESEIIKSVSIPWLAAAHAQAGNLDKARQIVARVNSSDGLRRGVPPFLQTTYYYYPFKKKADIEHLIEGMRKAGWPDEDK